MPSCRSLGRAVLVLLMLGLFAGPAAAQGVVVFAAASLRTALDTVAEAWRAETGERITLSYAGSAALARQIDHGAPADLFISANTAWMDWLEEAGALRPETRVDLLGNALVLIGHGAVGAVEPLATLPGRLGAGRLAMALPDAVPAGIYGKAALRSLGLWDSVSANVAQTDNVRAALALVARGEAPFGIVYATDAAAEDRVSIVARFAPETHPAIVYPAALTADAAAGQGFLDFLSSETARALFLAQGFSAASR